MICLSKKSLELLINMDFECVALLWMLHGNFTVSCVCVVQFGFAMACAVFDFVSRQDILWFGGY
jgi:hypothetical protein